MDGEMRYIFWMNNVKKEEDVFFLFNKYESENVKSTEVK